MTLPDLTVKERMLLHLSEFGRYAEEYEVPVEVTQEGLAAAAGIQVRHVSQYLRPLVKEDKIREANKRVRGKPQRGKAYFLTEAGRSEAALLRGGLLKQPITFRTGTGELVEVPLARLHQEHRRGATVLDLLKEMDRQGFVDAAPTAATPEAVDFSQEAPRVDRFYGRKEELAAVTRALEEKPVVVVTGMAGMGKSTLAAKVCEALRGRRPLFWRQVRPWDTGQDLAGRLAVFLKALGRTSLHAGLAGGDAPRLSRLEELLASDVAGVRGVLVFDDVHHATGDSQAFLSILLRVLHGKASLSALLLSRTVPDFYSRQDVEVDGFVVEIPLKGLDPASRRALLADAGIPENLLGELAEASGGSPLFLRLLAAAGTKLPMEHAWRTVTTYIAEQIEPSLNEAERECLQVASLFEVPVPPDALMLGERTETRTLVGLERKGILDRTDGDRFALHESLREYFRTGIPSDRKQALTERAVTWLMRQGEGARVRGHLGEAIGYVANAAAIQEVPAERWARLAQLGDLRLAIGDASGATEAYRLALRDAKDAEASGQLSQKLAASLQAEGQVSQADREVEGALHRLPAAGSLATAWLRYRKASGAFQRGRYESAAEEADRVKALLPGLPRDMALAGRMAELQGWFHLDDPRQVDPARARASFQVAIDIFQQVNDAYGLCRAYAGMALAAVELGQTERAMDYLAQSAALAESRGDVPARLSALRLKAWCLAECLGDYTAAASLFDEVRRIAEEHHQEVSLVVHHRDLADLYRREGRFHEAREALARYLALTASGDLFNAEERAEDLGLMVRLCLLDQAPEDARRYLEEAEQVARQTASDRVLHAMEWARGARLASEGNALSAEESFRQARERAPPAHGGETRGEFLMDYARFLSDRGDRQGARSLLLQAVDDLGRASRRPLERTARHLLQAVESSPAPP